MRLSEISNVVDLGAKRQERDDEIKQWRKDNPPDCPRCGKDVVGVKKYAADDPDWLCMHCMTPIEDKRK